MEIMERRELAAEILADGVVRLLAPRDSKQKDRFRAEAARAGRRVERTLAPLDGRRSVRQEDVA